MKISIDKDHLKFFGSSGIHLYAATVEMENETKHFFLDGNTEAINLYKVYQDLAVFLSDDLDISPFDDSERSMAIYGNPQHDINSIAVGDGYQIIGILDSEDIDRVVGFLSSHSLNTRMGVETYFHNLCPEVKKEMEMLLDDRIVDELFSYLSQLFDFYTAGKAKNTEVVILANG